jgi:septum formation protein
VLESPDMPSGKRENPQLYLASNSPRRKELLSLIGWDYQLLSSQVDETRFPNEDGVGYVTRIAKTKAHTAANRAGVDGVVIAADTAVIDCGVSGKSEIFGKPSDRNEAVAMLRRLRGHTHQVCTAISILPTPDGTIRFDLCTTDVPMRNYNDEEIEAYVASGDPMDKAGAYAIQHAGFHPVGRLQGCFANVMGLPLCHLTRSLSKLGFPAHVDVPHTCQSALRYECPVYHQVLKEKTSEFAYS